MKKLLEIAKSVVTEFFQPLFPCDCWKLDEDDHFGGKIFKHYRTGNLYRFLLTATSKGLVKENLMVIYQDVESGRQYVRQWNDFFSSTKLDGKQVPRFEEQEDKK